MPDTKDGVEPAPTRAGSAAVPVAPPAAPDMRALAVFAAPKAGTSEEDAARISAKIYELSRNSPYFQNQLRKDQEVDRKITAIMKKLRATEATWRAQPPAMVAALERGAVRRIERLRAALRVWFREPAHSTQPTATATEPAPAATAADLSTPAVVGSPVVDAPLDILSLSSRTLIALLHSPVFTNTNTSVNTNASTHDGAGITVACGPLPPAFVHVDLDSFYASVAELDNPTLRGRPLAVGDTSMISTSSYAARRFGVRSAMPGFIGRALCPELVFVPLDFPRYRALAAKYRAEFRRFDPRCAPSFLDEASLDVAPVAAARALAAVLIALDAALNRESKQAARSDDTETETDKTETRSTATTLPTWLPEVLAAFKTTTTLPPATIPSTQQQQQHGQRNGQQVSPLAVFVDWTHIVSTVAADIRARVFASSGLTCSAGIGGTRMAAKVASDANKPNGQATVPLTSAATEAFFATLPVRKVPGFGRVSEKLLRALGVERCGELLAPRTALRVAVAFSEGTAAHAMRVATGVASTSAGRTSTVTAAAAAATAAATTAAAEAAAGGGESNGSMGLWGDGDEGDTAPPLDCAVVAPHIKNKSCNHNANKNCDGDCGQDQRLLVRVRVRGSEQVRSALAAVPARAAAAAGLLLELVSVTGTVYTDDDDDDGDDNSGDDNNDDDDAEDDDEDERSFQSTTTVSDSSSSKRPTSASSVAAAALLPPLPPLDLSRPHLLPLSVIRDRKSLSNERTFAPLATLLALRRRLRAVAALAAGGLLRRRLAAGTLTVKLKFANFETTQRTASLAPAAAAGRRALLTGMLDGLKALVPQPLAAAEQEQQQQVEQQQHQGRQHGGEVPSSDGAAQKNESKTADASEELEWPWHWSSAPPLIVSADGSTTALAAATVSSSATAGAGGGATLSLSRPLWTPADVCAVADALLVDAYEAYTRTTYNNNNNNNSTHGYPAAAGAAAAGRGFSLRLMGVRASTLYAVPEALAVRADRFAPTAEPSAAPLPLWRLIAPPANTNGASSNTSAGLGSSRKSNGHGMVELGASSGDDDIDDDAIVVAGSDDSDSDILDIEEIDADGTSNGAFAFALESDALDALRAGDVDSGEAATAAAAATAVHCDMTGESAVGGEEVTVVDDGVTSAAAVVDVAAVGTTDSSTFRVQTSGAATTTLATTMADDAALTAPSGESESGVSLANSDTTMDVNVNSNIHAPAANATTTATAAADGSDDAETATLHTHKRPRTATLAKSHSTAKPSGAASEHQLRPRPQSQSPLLPSAAALRVVAPAQCADLVPLPAPASVMLLVPYTHSKGAASSRANMSVHASDASKSNNGSTVKPLARSANAALESGNAALKSGSAAATAGAGAGALLRDRWCIGVAAAHCPVCGRALALTSSVLSGFSTASSTTSITSGNDGRQTGAISGQSSACATAAPRHADVDAAVLRSQDHYAQSQTHSPAHALLLQPQLQPQRAVLMRRRRDALLAHIMAGCEGQL